MKRIALLALLAFVLGTVITYAVVVFGTLIAWDLLGVHDRDGGGSMGLVFVIGPVAGLLGGAIAAAVTGMRASRTSTPGQKQRTALWLRAAGGGVLGFLCGYWLGGLVGFLAMTASDGALIGYVVTAWAPTLLALALAVAGMLFVVRRAASARV